MSFAWRLIVALLLLAIAVVTTWPNASSSRTSPPATPLGRAAISSSTARPTREQLLAVLRGHMAAADAEADAAIESRLTALRRFFDESKRGSRLYSEEAIGFGSKWRFVYDFLPFTNNDHLSRYLRQRFEVRIYKPDDLRRELEAAVAGSLQDLNSIEGKLLVKARADVAATWPDLELPQAESIAMQARLTTAIDEMLRAADPRLPTELSVDLASFVAGEILTFVAIEATGSSAVLGVGAASSVATFGIGLVVSVVVDYLVAKAWNWYADPAAALTDKMNAQLDAVYARIVDGIEGRAGLRGQLKDYAKRRGGKRNEAVLQLLGGESS